MKYCIRCRADQDEYAQCTEPDGCVVIDDDFLVNRHHALPYDVYIGRGSIWGNPYRIGSDGNRDDVIRKYREWILTQPDLIARLDELDGLKLGCYCKPNRCHGEILLELIELKKRGELDVHAP